MNKIKITLVFFMFIYVFLSGCADIKTLYYWGCITDYDLPSYSGIYFYEAMEEMFYKYPEMRITSEIIKIKKNTRLRNYFITKKRFYNVTDTFSFTEKSGVRFPSYAEWIITTDEIYPDFIDENYIKSFFGINTSQINEKQFITKTFKIVSNDSNIFIIRFFYTYFNESPALELTEVELSTEQYESKFAEKRSFSENRKIKREFESDILPKIKECIEIVKQRKKIENGK